MESFPTTQHKSPSILSTTFTYQKVGVSRSLIPQVIFWRSGGLQGITI